MTDKQIQTEVMRLVNDVEYAALGFHATGGIARCIRAKGELHAYIAQLEQRLTMRIAELEAQLESVGAGGVGAMMPKQLAAACDECGATHRPGENTLCPTFRPQQIAEPAVAIGWKLVPLEPTAEMLQAGQDAPVSESDEDAPEDYKAVYRAMLAAAPHPQQIAGLDKDAEITALKAERDALRKDAERYRFVVGSTDHSMAKWHDCEGWYAIDEVDLDADMQAQAVQP